MYLQHVLKTSKMVFHSFLEPPGMSAPSTVLGGSTDAPIGSMYDIVTFIYSVDLEI